MKKSYRILSGVGGATICQRVSDVLAEDYISYGNPTVKMFEQRLALLEGAKLCRATLSKAIGIGG